MSRQKFQHHDVIVANSYDELARIESEQGQIEMQPPVRTRQQIVDDLTLKANKAFLDWCVADDAESEDCDDKYKVWQRYEAQLKVYGVEPENRVESEQSPSLTDLPDEE